MTEHETNDDRDTQNYWFPAKCFGWGWGLPCSWQGWLVFLGFILICYLRELLAGGSTGGAVLIVILAAMGLLAIAYWKGEPPRWRWGGKD